MLVQRPQTGKETGQGQRQGRTRENIGDHHETCILWSANSTSSTADPSRPTASSVCDWVESVEHPKCHGQCEPRRPPAALRSYPVRRVPSNIAAKVVHHGAVSAGWGSPSTGNANLLPPASPTRPAPPPNIQINTPVERERPVRPCRPTSIRLPAPACRGSGCARWFLRPPDHAQQRAVTR